MNYSMTRNTDNPQVWTYKEIEQLRREYPVRLAEEIAKDLGRPLRSVYNKAYSLGLKKSSYGIVWTPQMITMIKAMFPITFDGSLATCLRVSKRSLIRKARELGLEKEPDFIRKHQKEINAKISESVKKCSNTSTRFKKGNQNPDTQFKPGHVLSPEAQAKKVASYKATVRLRKRQEQFRRDYNINNQ